jgi:predicted RNase H-like nuclease
MPTHLLVGFDSAWTRQKSGALVGAVRKSCGAWEELGTPLEADFPAASRVIRRWTEEVAPDSVVVMLDQPTIVQNSRGQRPAPLWEFLDEFGGPADLLLPPTKSWVIETYPALALLSLGWALPDPKRGSRLPKYNPARRKTFRIRDWVHVCRSLRHDLWSSGLHGISDWLSDLEASEKPGKSDQDGLDACLCLAIGIRLVEGGRCLMVGDNRSGYILVPWSETLKSQIEARCKETGRPAEDWVRVVSVEWSLG